MRTVDAVRTLAQQARALPEIRSVAVSITRKCGRTDEPCMALAVLEWVKAHLRYVKDPVDTELVHAPALLVNAIARDGQTAGDCDDAACLIAALDQSIGLRARLVVGSYRPDRQLHHIWVEAIVRPRTVLQDPFRAIEFNQLPTRIVTVPV